MTRGTVVEPGLLDDKRNNYLMAVALNARATIAGIAYCDITTGEFAATQIEGKVAADLEERVGQELSRLQPSELIHVDWDPGPSSLQGLIAVLNPLLSTVENWQVAEETAEESTQTTLPRDQPGRVWTAGPCTGRARRGGADLPRRNAAFSTEPDDQPAQLRHRRVHDPG